MSNNKTIFDKCPHYIGKNNYSSFIIESSLMWPNMSGSEGSLKMQFPEWRQKRELINDTIAQICRIIRRFIYNHNSMNHIQCLFILYPGKTTNLSKDLLLSRGVKLFSKRKTFATPKEWIWGFSYLHPWKNRGIQYVQWYNYKAISYISFIHTRIINKVLIMSSTLY